MNIIDYVSFGILALFLVFGIKNGIAKVLLRFGATLLSAVAARIGAQYASSYIYDSFLHEKINGKLLEIFPAGSIGGSLSSLIESLKSALPEKVYEIADFLHLLPEKGKFDTLYTVAELEQTYVQPIITKVLLIITTLALFFILSVILMLVVNALNKHFFEDKHGVISTLNRVAGGMFGIVRGAIPVAALCAVLNLIAPIVKSEAFGSLVENSMLCGFIASIF